MRRFLRSVGILALAIALTATEAAASPFTIAGFETLTEPGPAHLVLAAEVQGEWANQTLRVEISGPMEATLLYPGVESLTDLGRFDLPAGNYTVHVYVLPELGPTVRESGSVTYQEAMEFTVPKAPELSEPDRPLIDPESLGFMITALFVFGLLLAIWQTTNRPSDGDPGGT